VNNDLQRAIARLAQLKDDLPVAFDIPSDELVNHYESCLGLHFHQDFRYFIKNLGYASYNGLENLTIEQPAASYGDLLKCNMQAREMGMPQNLLAFVEDNGDYFCLQADGSVVFWSHNGPVKEHWPNLADWMEDVWINGN